MKMSLTWGALYCDRMIHDAYTIFIGGKESMRKRKGLQDI